MDQLDAVLEKIPQSTFYSTDQGAALCADAKTVLGDIPANSINLIITSPPFALQREKAYGNVGPDEYVDWFGSFAEEIYRILRDDGSFVLEIAGSWTKGEPTRTLYPYKLLLHLCETLDFHLAQEFYWYNPARMPAPAQWVNIERIRVKSAVTPIWWLSKTPRPNADNRRVLTPYSDSMRNLLENGYNEGRRPSGYDVSDKWQEDRGGAIPPNLIEAANTKSKDRYLNGCKEWELELHPARFVDAVPEFFIDFLTEENQLVLDPFAGSNVVGAIAEQEGRSWLSVEVDEEYVVGSSLRFESLGDSVVTEWAAQQDVPEAAGVND